LALLDSSKQSAAGGMLKAAADVVDRFDSEVMMPEFNEDFL